MIDIIVLVVSGLILTSVISVFVYWVIDDFYEKEMSQTKMGKTFRRSDDSWGNKKDKYMNRRDKRKKVFTERFKVEDKTESDKDEDANFNYEKDFFR